MGPQRRSGSAPRQQSFARHPDARSKPDQRPAWNDTNGNVDKWKLTPDELNKRRQQRISKNRITADAARRGSLDPADWARDVPSASAGGQYLSEGGSSTAAAGIDYGAVLQMLQQPEGRGSARTSTSPGAGSLQQSPPVASPPRSFEEEAAAAAAAMAEAASRLPLDLTLNPRSGLYRPEAAQEAARGTASPHHVSATPSPAPASTAHDGAPRSSVGAKASPLAHPAAAGAADAAGAAVVLAGEEAASLLQRQQQLERRMVQLEAQAGDADTLRSQLASVQGELRQLKEESGGLRRELTEFSRHASTLMSFVHSQVLQLLKVQGLQGGEGQFAAPAPAPAPAAHAAVVVAAPAAATTTADTYQQQQQQQQPSSYQAHDVGGSGSPGSWRHSTRSPVPGGEELQGNSWMFGGAGGDRREAAGPTGGWGAEEPAAAAAAVGDSWGAATFKRSIFYDLPESPQQPSLPQHLSPRSRPTASPVWPPRRPAAAPAPHTLGAGTGTAGTGAAGAGAAGTGFGVAASLGAAAAGAGAGAMAVPAFRGQQVPGGGTGPSQWPVKDIERDLEVLPSYTAFRKSAVSKAVTAAAAAAAPGMAAGHAAAPAAAPAPVLSGAAGAHDSTPVAPGRVRAAMAHTTMAPPSRSSVAAPAVRHYGAAAGAAAAAAGGAALNADLHSSLPMASMPRSIDARLAAPVPASGTSPAPASFPTTVASVQGAGLDFQGMSSGVVGEGTARVDAGGAEAGPAMSGSGVAGLQLRPLPTQFQPRSLGHASILVQSHIDTWDTVVASGDASARPARPAGARRGIAWEVSASAEAREEAEEAKGLAADAAGAGAGGSFWVGQPPLGGDVVGQASPRHAASGAYLSLAAYAAAAQRAKGKRLAPRQ